MSYPVKAVANAMLRIAEDHGAPLSPLKLQKLVYIAHGWHLGLSGEPLVADELPEAWQYGPVFPSLYREFKEYGRGSIKTKATDVEITDKFDFKIVEPEIDYDDSYTSQLLKKVWDEYGKYGAIALSDLTHKIGTPWEQTSRTSGGIKNADIPNDLIREHYQKLIARRKA